MHLFAAASVTTSLLALASAPSPQAPADKLPESPGKAVLTMMCTSCHGTDVITDAPRTVPSWVDTVLSMKDFGAQGSDEDWKAVTDYIVVNLAHLEVNKSTAAEMAQVLRVSEKVAEGVVAYREKQGGFKAIADLKQAPGLDAATIDTLAPRLIF
jgi:competence ComEA-like helix-hairpin-helix protein